MVQLQHGGYGWGGVSDADPIGDAPCRHGDGRRNLQNGKVYIKKSINTVFQNSIFCPKNSLLESQNRDFWNEISSKTQTFGTKNGPSVLQYIEQKYQDS